MAKTALLNSILCSVMICLPWGIGGCRGVDPGSFEVEPLPEAEGDAAVERPQESAAVPAAEPAEGDPSEKAVREARDSAAEPNAPGPAVELTLKFAPGQTVTYKVTTEVLKSVQWEGASGTKPAAFKGGHTGNRVEMTFEQQVESVDAEGDAVVQITIKALKYVGRMRDNVVLDFDSARDEDRRSPLATLVGKSYKLEMSARGEILALIDVEPLRQALQGPLPAHDTAQKLLSRGQILQRHEVVAISALSEKTVRPGQDWSSVKAFSFGMMGTKSYERIYTLKEVQPDEGPLAVVEMKAIPSAALAEEMHKQQAVNPFAGMFDNTESYEGRFELELDTGAIRRYVEEMHTEWVVADPAAVSGEAEPSALRMAAMQLYHLESVESSRKIQTPDRGLDR